MGRFAHYAGWFSKISGIRAFGVGLDLTKRCIEIYEKQRKEDPQPEN
jgi:hypothetical protein